MPPLDGRIGGDKGLKVTLVPGDHAGFTGHRRGGTVRIGEAAGNGLGRGNDRAGGGSQPFVSRSSDGTPSPGRDGPASVTRKLNSQGRDPPRSARSHESWDKAVLHLLTDQPVGHPEDQLLVVEGHRNHPAK